MILFLVVLGAAAAFFFGFWLPGWNDMQRRHQQFDQKWQQQRLEIEQRRREMEEGAWPAPPPGWEDHLPQHHDEPR